MEHQGMGMQIIYLFGVFCYVTCLSNSLSHSNKLARERSLSAAASSVEEFRKYQLPVNLSELANLHVEDEGHDDDFGIPSLANKNPNIMVIGIAGGSGSGKTTLAQAIYDAIGEENITYISHDSYYRDISHLPLEEREKQNFDHPNSLETSLLIEHLAELKKGNSVAIPRYDFGTHSRLVERDMTFPRPVILVEGILIFSEPNLLDLFDIRVFVDTEDDIRLIRRIQRDTVERKRTLESILHQYLTTVRPMHLEFVESSKRNAHIIVPVGLNRVALELVVSRLKASIRHYRKHSSSKDDPSKSLFQ